MDRKTDIVFYPFGDMTAVFFTAEGTTQFLLLPSGKARELDTEKLLCLSPAGHVIHREPMLHVALAGDGYSCDFTAGRTQRNSDTAYALCMVGQTEEHGDVHGVRSEFRNGAGLRVTNILEYREGDGFVTSRNVLENEGEDVLVEALPSFGFSGISPFVRYNEAGKIKLWKLLSDWSAEGRPYSVTADRLGFEPSWSGLGIRMEKWSQTGSMPSNGQLPFVAVEDGASGVCWAAMPDEPASWQIELVFRNGNLSVGGGQGDFLTSHWRKLVRKGEKIETRRAYLTAAFGGLDEVCARLLGVYARERRNGTEEELPVLYNEWCASWGRLCEEELERSLPVARNLGCKYFVVDDGWFEKKENAFKVLGDWRVSKEAFPHGLKAFSEKVSSYGMKPGLWYEFERVSKCSDLFAAHPDWMLSYEGKPIVHQGKAFLDFRKEEVTEYLRERVIGALKENGIGYLKLDYNDSIGVGADGAESYGEALRAHTEGVLAFCREIKRTLPDLVLEICASGGMRHSPAFLSIADMVSFSDAHESAGGANIACALHRFLPPRKMQVWATIRASQTEEEAKFVCAKAMTGRICFSGRLTELPEGHLNLMREAVDFYEGIKPVLARGRTVFAEDGCSSWFSPKGTVSLAMESEDGSELVLYAFALSSPCTAFRFDTGGRRLLGAYNAPPSIDFSGGKLSFTSGNVPLWGCVIRLGK